MVLTLRFSKPISEIQRAGCEEGKLKHQKANSFNRILLEVLLPVLAGLLNICSSDCYKPLVNFRVLEKLVLTGFTLLESCFFRKGNF